MAKDLKTRFWMPHYASNTDELLTNIPIFWSKIESFIREPKNKDFIDGYLELHIEYYITEHNRHKVQRSEDLIPSTKKKKKKQTKEENLKEALTYVFGDIKSYSLTFTKRFSVELVFELHKILAKGLFSSGQYRQNEAKPAGYNFNYLKPHEIEERMNKLFQRVDKVIEANRNDWYEIASSFFQEFLYIHPFHNGNGRIANILLSVLLTNYFIAPVSIFPLLSCKGNFNKVYLKCLEEAHDNENDVPLKYLIIEGLHSSLESFILLLDV